MCPKKKVFLRKSMEVGKNLLRENMTLANKILEEEKLRWKNDSEKIRFLSAKTDHRHLRTIVQGLCSICSIDSINSTFKKRKNFETPPVKE